MNRYLAGLIGLAVIGASSLVGGALAFGGEAACCPAAACNDGCNCGCNDACDRCPRCGCKLVPVCQIGCTTKSETTHKYTCVCKEICVPAVTPIFGGCESCENCGACATGCAACDPAGTSCQDGCNCRIHEVHKLVVHPVTKETPGPHLHGSLDLPELQQLRDHRGPQRGACRARPGCSGAERQSAAAAGEDDRHHAFA